MKLSPLTLTLWANIKQLSALILFLQVEALSAKSLKPHLMEVFLRLPKTPFLLLEVDMRLMSVKLQLEELLSQKTLKLNSIHKD
jgi:hypothetical protein